jgi:hypothetical protein
MRNFGGFMVVLGIVGFLYCSDQASKAGAVPEGKSISESLEYDAGRWEVGRYVCAGIGVFGLLMTMFPKGR